MEMLKDRLTQQDSTIKMLNAVEKTQSSGHTRGPKDASFQLVIIHYGTNQSPADGWSQLNFTAISAVRSCSVLPP